MRHNFKSLINRLSKAGFKKEFTHLAILPDWWDESCEDDESLLTEIEIRVARFLGLSLGDVGNPAIELLPPLYPQAHLRQVRDIEADRLAPAIHTALQISAAVIRSMKEADISCSLPPANGFNWRAEIKPDRGAITLDEILSDLWHRGIPVIPIEVLPSPSFQGLAGIVEKRPVIVIGHKYDAPGRVAHYIAHEVGHIASQDCQPNQPVIDEDQEIIDESSMEITAEQYATRVMVGADTIPKIEGNNFRQLAEEAIKIEEQIGADAGNLIFTWASKTHDYQTATLAVKALYRDKGARTLLYQYLNQNIDLDLTAESDWTLLQCVFGDRE